MGPLSAAVGVRRILGTRRIAVASAAAAVLLIGQLVAGLAVRTVLAADPVTFGQPTATSSFGKSIEFKQPVTLAAPPARVEILLTTPGSIGPSVVPLIDPTPAGATTLDYRVDLSDGHVVPNTTFTARWRVTDASGAATTGPAVRHTYDDDRFTWKTLDGDVVRVHWIEGNQAFGRRALKIGDDAVAATAALLGVTESEPIDFFIYADQDAFYAALGPATRENVGGQAHPDIRTLFALITPADIDASWVESVVPHELTHVVFATAVDNPYHDPPHWLNEGLAVYLSDGYGDFDRSQVEAAAKGGSIIPLDGLAGAFPTTRDRFFLAYAESVSAVDRIVRINGRDALVKLIRSYATGVSDDDAFQAALGRDVAGFEADWLGELGAKPPTRQGPQPAPVGPLPEGWSGPVPNPSFEVVGSLPPVQPGAPIPTRPEGADGFGPVVIQTMLIGGAVIVVAVALFIRTIRRRPEAATADNRLFGRAPVDEPPAGDPGPAGPQPRAPHPVDPAGEAPSSRLWSTTDWSLPRDPDGTSPGASTEVARDPSTEVARDPSTEVAVDPPTNDPAASR